MDLVGHSIYLGCTLIAGAIGYYIVQNIIVNDYEIKNIRAALTFSVVFALSCNGFMTLIFEVL